jgi:hypothetical protein
VSSCIITTGQFGLLPNCPALDKNWDKVYVQGMKKITIFAALAVVGLIGSAMVAFADTGVVLVNSGLGQKAGDVTDFGVAVCDQGSVALSHAVPISVTVNGVTVSANSPASLAVGGCGYTYLNYHSFNLSTGQTYSVQTIIDPQGTTVSNSNTQALYSMTVPSGAVLGASAISSAVRAQLLAQLANMVSLLQSLLARAKALGL